MARKYDDNSRMYIEGNAVRREQTVPKREPAVAPKSREEIRRERERYLYAKRNRDRAMSITPGYVVFLTIAAAICFFVCMIFIHLQSDITAHMSEITALEAEVSDQKSDNDAAENRLETTMTLDEVKLRAEELGLIYPSSEQIQYYSVESSDYMNQYSDVDSQ